MFECLPVHCSDFIQRSFTVFIATVPCKHTYFSPHKALIKPPNLPGSSNSEIEENLWIHWSRYCCLKLINTMVSCQIKSRRYIQYSTGLQTAHSLRKQDTISCVFVIAVSQLSNIVSQYQQKVTDNGQCSTQPPNNPHPTPLPVCIVLHVLLSITGSTLSLTSSLLQLL